MIGMEAEDISRVQDSHSSSISYADSTLGKLPGVSMEAADGGLRSYVLPGMAGPNRVDLSYSIWCNEQVDGGDAQIHVDGDILLVSVHYEVLPTGAELDDATREAADLFEAGLAGKLRVLTYRLLGIPSHYLVSDVTLATPFKKPNFLVAQYGKLVREDRWRRLR